MAWLSKCSPVPGFPEYTGPYSVGSVDLEIPVSEISRISTNSQPDEAPSTSCARLFYPCQKPKSSTRPIYWVQKPQRSIVSAFAKFLGAGNTFSDLVSYCPNLFTYIRIPAFKNASLLDPDTESGRWPVMVFSHGLGGSRNTYSYICASLASHGIVVVAPEHRDGSSPVSHIHAKDPSHNSAVYYQHISHTPSDTVYEARDRQLQIRIWELNVAYEALMMIANGVDIATPASSITKNVEKITPIREAIAGMANKLSVHDPGSITWAGHSFGAATTIQLVKSVFYASSISTRIYSSDPASSLEQQINQISPVVLLDPWGLPLDSPATSDLFAQPMPCFAPDTGLDKRPDESPLLAVLSAAFVDWKGNFRTIRKVLSNPNTTNTERPPAHIFYPLNSAHLAQSDFGMLFPTLSRYLAKSEDCERTMKLNLRATLELLRRRGFQVTPAPADEALDQSVLEASLDADGQEGDWRILDQREGAIKNWVRIEVGTSMDGTSTASSSSSSTPTEEKHDKMAKTLPATTRPSLKNFTSVSANSIKAVKSSLRSKANLVRRSTSYGQEKARDMGHGGGHKKILSGATVTAGG